MARLRRVGRRPSARALVTMLLAVAGSAGAQELVEWTEEPGTLGLGYPVPVPVDTPLPFDGFRSYEGILARHEQLALESGLLERTVIGESHYGREIVAWRLGDPDSETRFGLSEPAMMIQGGIHAREWQSPEVVTGVVERLVEGRGDAGLHDYLLENVNIVVVPVLNVDGFLQTQRFPNLSYLGADPTSARGWPRDGRMTRKNLLDRDEDIDTADDHLQGVDLNRNNPPFWNSSGSSSTDPKNLQYHGPGPQSEPETEAMVVAVDLAPPERLRVFTDVHSFGSVFFSERTRNSRKNSITAGLLADMSNHHAALPGGRPYRNIPSTPGSGIGSTDEYFSLAFNVPSWTLEIEPENGAAEYGGLGTNNHDGFILPEDQIRRVRENLAQSFLVVYYHQAGPPAIVAARVTDVETGAAVHDLEWDVSDDETRVLHETAHRALQPGREYDLWVAFDKPMRWREGGEVVALPGQSTTSLRTTAELVVDDANLPLDRGDEAWLDAPGGAQVGYLHYRDDAWRSRFTIGDAEVEGSNAMLRLQFFDMVGLGTDADPATIADWGPGNWVRYEGRLGQESDIGGTDETLMVPFAAEDAPPFLVESGSTAAYFDPDHTGEGFLLEILDDGVAVVYWFTYDEVGNQRWFTGTGVVRGNEVVFDELVGATGGVFGDAFDSDAVRLLPAGRLSILFTGCDGASMRFGAGSKVFRQELTRLSTVDGAPCATAGKGTGSGITGSWYDIDRAGEGFVVQALDDGRALIYWFTWDPDGGQAWFFGDGVLDADGRVSLAESFVTRGGRFGDDFDPDDVMLDRWGGMSFDFACGSGTMSFEADDPAYGAGAFELTRLTRPAGTGDCP